MDSYLKEKWNKGTTRRVRAFVNSHRSQFGDVSAKAVIEHSIVYDGFDLTLTSHKGTNRRAFFGYGGGLKKTVVF